MTLFRKFLKYWGEILAVVAVASAIFVVVISSINWHRGIYAGYHYDDGLHTVAQIMAHKYGLNLTNQMKLGNPDVVNTHLNGLVTGKGQVRIYHLVGPRGVKYCVSIWGALTGPYGKYLVQKGCSW